MAMKRFQDRTILVTGAGSGMGRDAALRLAQDGARVLLWGRRAKPLEDLARDIQANGGTALAQVCDIADPDQIGAALDEAVGPGGRLDGVFANALHLGAFKPLAQTGPQDFSDLVAVNLIGTQQTVAQAMARMDAGSVVINASWTAHAVMPGTGAYAATKAGLIAMMRIWAVEAGPAGIRVNAISPGIILTPMADAVLDPAVSAQLSGHTPLRRNGRPGDICGTVAWLLSDDAAFVTGQEITVDGGFTLGGALR
ncbi:SDR family oxidoreductase [Pseudooceanicola sp. 216_PA32_1]|uniref:SDR family oxidoreductase n=1 Tax=Pseudooceanicola pacificus TaxID=2676438 RepID=A0A844W8F6_9RHOB|nr:SDR family oxidoreductase [Pseudooceanicola pacificus]MWB79114.1 SDR family oxidoreductase [Pseudooceanicola pacificus]